MFRRLSENWVYGGFLASLVLIALAPLFARGASAVELLTYLCLPVYMLHQYEEHDADRFRRFINSVVLNVDDALTVDDVFWINIAGVWIVLTALLWLVATQSEAYALAAAYLLVFNAAVHILQAIGLRRYNPGLVTSIVLFLPLGLMIVMELASRASVEAHAFGVGLALLIHVAIVARVAMRRASLQGRANAA